MLKGLTVVQYQVSRWAEAREFYEKRLGLTAVYGDDEMGWLMLAVPGQQGNITLAINRVAASVPREGGGIAIFTTDDINSARAELERKGVAFEGETQVMPGMVKIASFRDPDGNMLQLFEDLGG